MTAYSLRPHPDFPSIAVTAIAVVIERSVDFLHLRYELEGDCGLIRWPAAVEPNFTDGLWQHTCFEAFCGVTGRERYREVNLSPSGEWAVYDFSGYRRGMTRAARQPLRHFRAGDRQVEAVVDIGAGDWRIGLAAVIEDVRGEKSYWALAHARGKPDFHHAPCFSATLPAPTAP